MNNLKKISEKIGIIIIFSILLSGFIYFIPVSEAASPQKGNFIILGRTENNQLIDEKIDLKASPGVSDVVQARVMSGTTVLVLDRAVSQGKDFYIVSTVGKDGGIIGWVSGEYINKIVPAPKNE